MLRHSVKRIHAASKLLTVVLKRGCERDDSSEVLISWSGAANFYNTHALRRIAEQKTSLSLFSS